MARLRLRFGLLAMAAMALACPFSANSSAAAQQSFASPQDGFAGLATAIKGGDLMALEGMLGPEGRDIIYSGDDIADANARTAFAEAYAVKHAIERLDATHAVLAVGADSWEFPIPLTRQGGAWRFDTATGKEELLNRRIGRNERATIKASVAYVAAQREYAAQSDGRYAQRVVSSAGEHDGLYWPARSGEAQSPLGPLFAQAASQGYVIPDARPLPNAPSPYYGYLYRILTAQGPAANGGRRDYVVDGKMTGGYALIATPATYGASGVMTFIVDQEGVVFQRDLGPDTAARAARIAAFNPDKGWSRTQ